MSFDELVVNLDIRSIFKRAPVIEEFIVRKPYVHLVRNKDKTYNFSDLLALMKEEPKEEKKEPPSSRSTTSSSRTAASISSTAPLTRRTPSGR